MAAWKNPNGAGGSGARCAAANARLPRWRRRCVSLILLATLGGIAQNPITPGGALRTDLVDMATPINQAPDSNAQMQMRDQQSKQQNFAAANAERKKQIAEDSARLLKLANDLKAEVDKTSKDTLSLTVIRKADEIEKLAHAVKEKMKLTVAAN
ncbi:MAG: hypothetical protein P4L26_06395 [Terracidiphilus sp.]|nr:hypothetical protein [Terracidiphilus sp.]